MHRVIDQRDRVQIPEASITNDELVESFNAYVDAENARRAGAGAPPLSKSDDGVHRPMLPASRTRHVQMLDGILDPARMAPRIPARDDSELSVMAEFGVESAKRALDDAGLDRRATSTW